MDATQPVGDAFTGMPGGSADGWGFYIVAALIVVAIFFVVLIIVAFFVLWTWVDVRDQQNAGVKLSGNLTCGNDGTVPNVISACFQTITTSGYWIVPESLVCISDVPALTLSASDIELAFLNDATITIGDNTGILVTSGSNDVTLTDVTLLANTQRVTFSIGIGVSDVYRLRIDNYRSRLLWTALYVDTAEDLSVTKISVRQSFEGIDAPKDTLASIVMADVLNAQFDDVELYSVITNNFTIENHGVEILADNAQVGCQNVRMHNVRINGYCVALLPWHVKSLDIDTLNVWQSPYSNVPAVQIGSPNVEPQRIENIKIGNFKITQPLSDFLNGPAVHIVQGTNIRLEHGEIIGRRNQPLNGAAIVRVGWPNVPHANIHLYRIDVQVYTGHKGVLISSFNGDAMIMEQCSIIGGTVCVYTEDFVGETLLRQNTYMGAVIAGMWLAQGPLSRIVSQADHFADNCNGAIVMDANNVATVITGTTLTHNGGVLAVIGAPVYQFLPAYAFFNGKACPISLPPAPASLDQTTTTTTTNLGSDSSSFTIALTEPTHVDTLALPS